MLKGNTGATYLVVENGLQFRTIAKTMTSAGFKMNHATARTKCTSAIRKLFNALLIEMQKTHAGACPVTLDEIMLNKEVHNTLPEILFAAFTLEEKE